ncbi:hypothetical protein KSF78_0006267 [Schistosoma japonicum]|nr:hypothetical protein KSF78_0006267 [Schistosoma japonicum]
MAKTRRLFECQPISFFSIYLILIYVFALNTDGLIGISGFNCNKRTQLFIRSLLPTCFNFPHRISYRSHRHYYNYPINSDVLISQHLNGYLGKMCKLNVHYAYERVKFILFYEFKHALQNIFEIEYINEKYFTKSTISKELWRNLIYNKLYAEYIIDELDVPISSIKSDLIQAVFNEIDYNGDGNFTPTELELFLQFHEIMP